MDNGNADADMVPAKLTCGEKKSINI
jgi:hypothetical protein